MSQLPDRPYLSVIHERQRQNALFFTKCFDASPTKRCDALQQVPYSGNDASQANLRGSRPPAPGSALDNSLSDSSRTYRMYSGGSRQTRKMLCYGGNG